MRNLSSARAAGLPFVLAIALGAILPFSASAQSEPNNCVAGKLGCVAKEAAAFLKCQALAQKTGSAISEECLAKARAKFLGAPDVAGCFATLEAKQKVDKPSSVCRTEGDAALTDALTEALTEAMSCGRDRVSCGGSCAHSPCTGGAALAECSPCVEKICDQPALADCCTTAWDAACVMGAAELCDLDCEDEPVAAANSCAGGKSLCLAKKVKGLLGCYRKAQAKGVAVDTLCLQKVETKFDGCFAKLEGKQNAEKPASVCPVDSVDAAALSDYAVQKLTCDLDGDACECCNDRCVDSVADVPDPVTDRSVYLTCSDTCKVRTMFSAQCGSCTGCEYGEICVEGECRCEVGEPRCQEIAPVPTCVNVSAASGMPSCGFLKNSMLVNEPSGATGAGTHGTFLDHFYEVETYENEPVLIYINALELLPMAGDDYTPILFSCEAGKGSFRVQTDTTQRDHFAPDGTITNLAGLLAATPKTVSCASFVDGPVSRDLPPLDPFDNPTLKGWYILFSPDAATSGRNYNLFSVMLDDSSSRTPGELALPFHVLWFAVHVIPGEPPVPGLP